MSLTPNEQVDRMELLLRLSQYVERSGTPPNRQLVSEAAADVRQSLPKNALRFNVGPPGRKERLADKLDRLGLNATPVAADAAADETLARVLDVLAPLVHRWWSYSEEGHAAGPDGIRHELRDDAQRLIAAATGR